MNQDDFPDAKKHSAAWNAFIVVNKSMRMPPYQTGARWVWFLAGWQASRQAAGLSGAT